MEKLNKSQQEAIERLNGPLLIAAGAGSGKTRTLMSRLAAILDSGVSPENIITITFTNKAADEMRRRISDYQASFIGTFHSLGARILRKEARFFGRTPNFSIFDEDDALRAVKSAVKNFNFSESRRETSPPRLRREFSRAKNGLVDSSGGFFEENLKILFMEYEKSLKKNNAFDFDDLIEKPVRLFEKEPEILEKYRRRFHYILVDEFQDINSVQYRFVRLLAQKRGNLSVVGDDQQAIYGFRGADFRIFLDFERDWPEAKTIFLEQNYRSSGNIIGAANAVISKNSFQKPKNLWTENHKGEPVKIVEHQGEDEEAQWMATQIQSLKIKSQNYNIAILYRTNAQSRAIESALIERGIPYLIFGGFRFYERKEIKDILAALRFSFNPKDLISVERLKTLSKKRFEAVKEKLADSTGSPADLIARVIQATDYFNYLKKNYLNSEERIENIKELIYFASGFKDLGEFLERVSLFQSTDALMDSKNRENAVRLMTVHLAKGLEFDDIFVAGLNEGIFPHQMSYGNADEIEEERRLMYVAMTRARKRLYLNFYNLPSRFLAEIPAEFAEFSGGRLLEDEERYIEI